jgi:alpha-tubulin suppressor-like RCC1 family protein
MVLGKQMANASPLCEIFPFKDKKIVQFCVGVHHSIILTDDGLVYVCGSNAQGEHGSSDYDSCPYRHLDRFNGVPVKYIAASGFFSMFQTIDNRVWYCGFHSPDMFEDRGQKKKKQMYELTQFTPSMGDDSTIDKIYLGKWHRFFISKTNQVWVGGVNS